jgi:S-adenosylmethionine:tRNA ribosyltransferase-isomerase
VSYRATDFDYHLPPELIAQYPIAERGTSRLLVVRRQDKKIEDRSFGELTQLIAPGDLLVLNSTRVRHARFLGTRPSGAPAEVLLLHPGAAGSWIAIGKPGSAMKPGKRIRLAPDIEVETVAELEEGQREVRFIGATAEEAIQRLGRLPLPPYIERDPDSNDEIRYQTVYAEQEGSVAAPTAGLHFTAEILKELERREVHITRLDLEVGPGTFKPVEVEDLSKHHMHPERFDIPEATATAIVAARKRKSSVWAVGTTVVRALESAATTGGLVQSGSAETRLMITPGFQFKVVDHLLTNFHLPRSTLLMLVSAFAGYDLTMAAYRHAVEERYRFYSYGDAMAVLPL